MQHSGGISSFKTYMSFMPRDSIGVIVLTNGQPFQFPQALCYDLYDRILRLPQTLWTEKFLPETKGRSEATKRPQIANTVPSKPLPDYAGIYHSKWLGDMKVLFENGELYFQFHNYPKEKMKHAHYDTFFTEPEREPGTGISFQLDHDGNVKAMLLKEIPFQKVKC